MQSIVKYGSKTNPQAGDTIVSSGNLTAGKYRVVVATRPTGTIAAGDADNVQLLNPSGGTLSVFMMNATAGSQLVSPEVRMEFTTGGTVALVAVANASGVAAVYNAQLILTPEALYE